MNAEFLDLQINKKTREYFFSCSFQGEEVSIKVYSPFVGFAVPQPLPNRYAEKGDIIITIEQLRISQEIVAPLAGKVVMMIGYDQPVEYKNHLATILLNQEIQERLKKFLRTPTD